MSSRTDYAKEIRAQKGGGDAPRPPVQIIDLAKLRAALARLVRINSVLNLPHLTEDERVSGSATRTTELLAQPPVYRRLLISRQDLTQESAVTPDVLLETIVDSDRATQLRSATEVLLWTLILQFYAVDEALAEKNQAVRTWYEAARKGQLPGVSPNAVHALFSRQREAVARDSKKESARDSKQEKAAAEQQRKAREAEEHKQRLRARDALLDAAQSGALPPKGRKKEG